MTNGWIFCNGSPTSNEKMLEAAMESTGAAPYAIVVDNLKNYRGKYVDNIDVLLSEASTTALYEAEQRRHRPKDTDIDFLFDDNYDVLYRRGSMVAEYQAGSSSSGRDNLWVMEDGKWKAQFPWKRGSHYIFCEKFDDFQSHLLGPAGYICIHGSNDNYEGNVKRTGYMIREAILTVKPCILFDNTGGEAQMYARLIHKIQDEDKKLIQGDEDGHPGQSSRRPSLWTAATSKNEADQVMAKKSRSHHYKDLRMRLRQRATDLQRFANAGQTGGDVREVILSLTDVVQIVDLYCDNPRLFTKIIVSVDPLNDSPEDIVKKMTLSFARANTEAKEVGAGDADNKAVEQAWRFHQQLHGSKSDRRYVLRPKCVL